MGLLKDNHYWGAVIAEVFRLRPDKGQPIDRETARALLRVACKALGDLADDRELEADIEECIKHAEEAQRNRPSAPDAFQSFLEQFLRAEKEVILQSGVDLDATVAICREIEEVLKVGGDPDILNTLPSKIWIARDVICGFAKDTAYLNKPPDPTLADDIRDGLIGTGLVGVDLAVAPVLGPTGGMVAGNSIGAGLHFFKKIWKRFW